MPSIRAAQAEGSSRQHDKPRADARTIGLGRACKVTADCIGRLQICLKEADANGNELKQGICALPCTAIDAGIANPSTDPAPAAATPDAAPAPKKPIPPRCPKKFQCRSAGAGVPIDLCIQE